MPRPTKRSEWHRTKTGAWTRSLGERGCRVRLFEKRSGGGFYREVYIPGEGRNQAPLGTRDRLDAEQLGKALLARLLVGKLPVEPGPVRLDELWRRYSTECHAHLDNRKSSQADARHRAPVLIGFFGAGKDVRLLSPSDIMQYQSARRAGGIRCSDGRVSQAVRQRSVHADLVLLRAMLRWACTVRLPNNQPWLDRNPLEGVRFERERNPVRPVATWERFTATRAKLQELAAAAQDGRERQKWVRLELALVLAEATGRRRGAIVALAWEDIDFAAGTIRWRAEHDKKGKEWLVPAPPALLEELRAFQRQLGAIGGRLFPSVRRPGEPMPPEMLSQWLKKAEDAGKLEKLAGGLWHPYRRKWASERMDLPLKAVADAGGWTDTTTLLTCYQQSDDATLLAVMSVPVKRMERRAAGAAP